MRSLNEAGTPASPFTPGTLLGGGRFQIQSLIGEGAIGAVCNALQVAIVRPVVGPKLIEQHLVEPPPRLSEIRPDPSIVPELESIARVLLAKR